MRIQIFFKFASHGFFRIINPCGVMSENVNLTDFCVKQYHSSIIGTKISQTYHWRGLGVVI